MVDIEAALQQLLLAAAPQQPQQQQQQPAFAAPGPLLASPFTNFDAELQLFAPTQQPDAWDPRSVLLSTAASCGLQRGAADSLDAALASW